MLPGGGTGFSGSIRGLIFGGICLIVIAIAARLAQFTYRVEDGDLKLSLVLLSKNRYIPFERIHSVDVSEGLFNVYLDLLKLILKMLRFKSGSSIIGHS